MAFAGGDGLVEDLAHGIEAGTALRRFAFAAKHLLATGCAGAGGRADVVIADSIADADDHASPDPPNDNANNSQAEDTQQADPDQVRMRTVRRIVSRATL